MRFTLVLVAVSILSLQANADITVLLRQGDSTPGGSDSFANLSNPTMVIEGDYIAVAHGGALSDGLVLAGCDRAFQTIARGSDALPSTNIISGLRGLGGPVLNASGQLAMPANTYLATNPNAARDDLFTADDSGAISQILFEGQANLSGDGFAFPRVTVSSTIDTVGRVAFSLGLYGGSVNAGTDEAIYLWDPATQSSTQVVRKGQATPNGVGVFTGTLFQASDVFFTPFVTDSGDVVFYAVIDGGAFGDQGLFVYNGQSTSRIIRYDDNLPGGVRFGSASGLDVDLQGRIAFSANWASTSTNIDGIYHYDGNTIRAIAASGDSTGLNETFRTFQNNVKLIDADTVAFEGNLTTPNGVVDGLWVSDGISLTTLFREGAPAPDAFGTFFSVNALSASRNGWVAFLARTTVGYAIYRYREGSGLEELVRTGDLIDGSAIAELVLGGREFSREAGVNGRGEVLFAYQLENNAGSGVALAGMPVGGIDSDADGVPDACDNCTAADNPDQIDADSDGYGNLCDADFTQDCVVNASDLAQMRQAFFTTDAVADLNSDGVVNASDLGLLRSQFFAPPGPSALGNCPDL